MVVAAYNSTFLAMLDDAAATSGNDPAVENERRGEIEQSLRPLFQEGFGNPFRPIAYDPAWLTTEVTDLAAHIHDSQAFELMPKLADSLEIAGCTAPEILQHCRVPATHVRGCWVVDSLRKKP